MGNKEFGIFAHWLSLDQMFKFSVSFATEVGKNRPTRGCFNRGLRPTKDTKRATEKVWLQPFLFFIFFYFSVFLWKIFSIL